MEQQGIFKISEPCHENWNGMSAEAQGRFCASCQRCVVDFTQKSHAEMKAIYDAAGGDVCGRVKVSQVVAPRSAIRARLDRIKVGAMKGMQMFALALLLAFSGLFHQEAQAQKPEIMGKVAYNPGRLANAEISGRVVVEGRNNQPAVAASVELYQDGTRIATTTSDAQGKYQFVNIPAGEYQISAFADHASAHMMIKTSGKKLECKPLVLEELRIMGGLRFEPTPIIEKVAILEMKDTMVAAVLEHPLLTDKTVRDADGVDSLGLDPLVPASAAELISADEAMVMGDFTVRAFPNPTSDKVTLVADRVGTEPLMVALLDLHGKLLYQGEWLATADNHQEITMRAFPAGTYILQVIAADQVIRRKLVKI